MPRMGHDSERAAIIYQHTARGADQAIAEAMGTHVEAQQADGETGRWRFGRARASGLIARMGSWVAVVGLPPMLTDVSWVLPWSR